MPEHESFDDLARHRCSLCIFLSIARIDAIIGARHRASCSDRGPVVVVEKATWPGKERILRGTLADSAALPESIARR
jgi:precorrin-4/cobalt-precorrin-4 C11-methyltransferase